MYTRKDKAPTVQFNARGRSGFVTPSAIPKKRRHFIGAKTAILEEVSQLWVWIVWPSAVKCMENFHLKVDWLVLRITSLHSFQNGDTLLGPRDLGIPQPCVEQGQASRLGDY